MPPRKLVTPPPLAPSVPHADGAKRCWGVSFTTPAQAVYHDREFGRAHPRGSGKILFKQLVLQTMQAGLSWHIVLAKQNGFQARFEEWEYRRVAHWGPREIEAALADPGIVRNGAKVRATVANARVATRLDDVSPGGFEAFLWQICGHLPAAERLLQHGSRTEGGSYMRASFREDFTTADGVHVTPGVAMIARRLKTAGFQFLGPATTLSFLQAAGFVNHHKPDCVAYAPAEAAYEAAVAAFPRAPHSSDSAQETADSERTGTARAERSAPPMSAAPAARTRTKRVRQESVTGPTKVSRDASPRAGSAVGRSADAGSFDESASRTTYRARRNGQTKQLKKSMKR